MKKSLFFISFFYVSTSSLFAMHDIIKLFTTNQIYNFKQSYLLQRQFENEYCYIAETLPIFPVKIIDPDEDMDQINIGPQINENNCLNPQCWQRYNTIRISDDINDTNDSYTICSKPSFPFIRKYDGINKNGISILGVTPQNINVTVFYIFKRMAIRRGEKEYPDIYQESLEFDGILNSLTLENNNNRIIYSVTHGIKHILYIADVITNQYPYAINEICSNDTLSSFKKIICLGNTHLGIKNKLSPVYLGLATDGTLFTFWFDDKKHLFYAPQKSGELKFLDIAVDKTYQCISGLCPKVVLIDTEGNVFITDLTQKDNENTQKLYCIYRVNQSKLNSLQRITYYNSICGIIFNDTYEQIYDCFDLITAAHLFKQQKKLPYNPNYNIKNNCNKNIVVDHDYQALRIDHETLQKIVTGNNIIKEKDSIRQSIKYVISVLLAPLYYFLYIFSILIY